MAESEQRVATPRKLTTEDLIHGLMTSTTGGDIVVSKNELQDTITNILKQYNLSTDLSFVEKIAKLKFQDNSESMSLDMIPKELTDAAFLPVQTIADIALRQDLDMVVSQIPEWYNALIVTRDAICEADTVDGTLARNIVFDRSKTQDVVEDSIVKKIESVEDRLRLHSIIKNHVVYNTLFYGEGYLYCVPYAKVFEDLYRYRTQSATKRDPRSAVAGMFETSSTLSGYGYGYTEAVEVSLHDTIVQESAAKGKKKSDGVCEQVSGLFSEAEIMEIHPGYHHQNPTAEDKAEDQMIDEQLDWISKNIHYINQDIALPVLEESCENLRAVYETKYHDTNFVQESGEIFKHVMEAAPSDMDEGIQKEFQNIPGVYLKVLPATKLIPIRIDRTIIGYYYISDMTRPDNAGERRNSGLTGYTLRSPSVGHDTYAPDRLFCEKLATKIINNFNLKFMRDNTALHKEMVTILEAHRFNDAMMRFIFIPAEHVCQCTINEDGSGKGHSMLEGGLITARMYMFLKMYTLLFSINNSAIRVYHVRQSGIDKNYKQLINETARKFMARRVTVNDVFNYRSSMSKVTGASEMMLPTGPDGTPALSVESFPAAESPIDSNLLDKLRAEAINATPVPAIMVQNGGVTEIEFSKETELANTRFTSFISSCKIDFNRDISAMYRKILRHETDIDPAIIHELKFVFKMPSAKTLAVTSDMIGNFEAMFQLMVKVLLTEEEQKAGGDSENELSPIYRETKLQFIRRYLPAIDVDDCKQLVMEARREVNRITLEETKRDQNLIDNADLPKEGEV